MIFFPLALATGRAVPVTDRTARWSDALAGRVPLTRLPVALAARPAGEVVTGLFHPAGQSSKLMDEPLERSV